MSAENVALSLKDIILGISESLNQAQDIMSNTNVRNENGQPGVQYTIPELNFSIEVEASFNTPASAQTSNLSRSSSLSQSSISRLASRNSLSLISFKPLPVATSTSTAGTGTSNRLTSNISGKFVAIMPNAGLPQIDIYPSITQLSNTLFEVSVLVVNSIGEPMVNYNVEFNFNEFLTKNLNGVENITSPTFDANISNTDSIGRVKNNVTIGADAYNYIIDINVGTLQKRISIQSVSQ